MSTNKRLNACACAAWVFWTMWRIAYSFAATALWSSEHSLCMCKMSESKFIYYSFFRVSRLRGFSFFLIHSVLNAHSCSSGSGGGCVKKVQCEGHYFIECAWIHVFMYFWSKQFKLTLSECWALQIVSQLWFGKSAIRDEWAQKNEIVFDWLTVQITSNNGRLFLFNIQK